jgi:hypothetical protein
MADELPADSSHTAAAAAETDLPETTLEQGQDDAIEADETDSAIGDLSDRGSVTTSLASSIYNYT